MRKCADPKCANETSNRIYCSVSCANSHRPKRQRKCAGGASTCGRANCSCQSSKPAKLCVVCGDPVTVKPYPSDMCDKPRCRYVRNSQSHPDLAKWLTGDFSADQVRGRHGVVTAYYARCYLLIESGWSCTQCGWDAPHPLTSLPPLEVDHVDGDPTNNRRSNLRVLCPNCHALTPTFRRHNEKHRRELLSVQASSSGVL